MFDNKPELTRRKALLAIGGVGAGGALAGGATTAFFSDKEVFEDNTLTTGELDLKVDWAEHYSDWSDDEGEGVTVSMRDDLDTESSFAFPSAAPSNEKLLYVDDKAQFLANTAIEAFPDENNDGRRDAPEEFDICERLADVPGVLENDLRTDTRERDDGSIGDPPNAQSTEPGDPIVDIGDIKPGDFGEVTFSFHLCGNPGFVWLMGQLSDADENGNSEPERTDPDEVGPGPNETDPQNRTLFDNEGDENPEPNGPTVQEPVELLDEIKAAVWSDTGANGFDDSEDPEEGNNYREPGEVVLLTGTLRNVLQILEGSMIPLTPTSGAGDGAVDPTAGDFPVCSSLQDDLSGSPFTSADLGVMMPRNIPCTELADLLADEGIVPMGTSYVGTKIEAGSLATGTFSAGNGGTIQVDSVDVQGGTVTLSTSFPIEAVTVKGGPNGQNNYVFGAQGGVGCALDEITFTTPPGQGSGNPAISNIEICYDPDAPSGTPATAPSRECFQNSTTAYVGFEWWLPVNHANEIQTDSVAFNLGFYTEQCRHNDGLDPRPPTNNSTNSGTTPD